MGGSTARVWSGDASAGGHDFAAVKLDADGSEVWRWQVKAACAQNGGGLHLG